MKCPNCSNELDQDEMFCGQCGAPNAVPAQQTEMIPQAPASPAPSPRNGTIGSPYRGNSFLSNQPFASENMPLLGPSAIPQGLQQSGSFHQDATEAFIPGSLANYAPSTHPPQSFPGGGPLSGYNNAGQFGTQQSPLATGNFANPNTAFSSTQMGFPNTPFGQGSYGRSPGGSMSARPQAHNSTLMVVLIVCLVLVVILVTTIGAVFALHGGNNNQAAQATAAPSPAPSPTPTATATSGPVIFSPCSSSLCNTYGFQVEYPQDWQEQSTSDQNGVIFIDNSQPETFADVKAPSGSDSPQNLISTDAGSFSRTPQADANSNPTPISNTYSNAYFGGQSWTCLDYTYPDAGGQSVQVKICAISNQGRNYVIELVAPQKASQSMPQAFDTVQNLYFNPMFEKSFYFVTPTPTPTPASTPTPTPTTTPTPTPTTSLPIP
jgi:hypothetical protein